jgi:Type II secretion system (T2SS), protein E, N-terminal domain
MSNEAAALPLNGLTTSRYTVKEVETVHDIMSTVERIIATGIEQIALVTIRLFYEKEDKLNTHRLMFVDKSTHYILNDLRTLVRKTDSVFLLGHNLYFLLPGATIQGGQIVQSRLWEALLWSVHNLSESDIVRPLGMAIGHSSYPIQDKTIRDFIAAADEASFRFDVQPVKATRKHAKVPQSQHAKDEVDEELPVLARKLGIPYLTFLPRKLPHSLQHLVNPKLAQELRCYPLGRERNMLTVAMLNPEDHSALDRLKQETGLHIFPVLAHPQALQLALEQLV